MNAFGIESYNDQNDSLLDTFDFDSFLNTAEDQPTGLGFSSETLHWTSDGVEAAGES